MLDIRRLPAPQIGAILLAILMGATASGARAAPAFLNSAVASSSLAPSGVTSVVARCPGVTRRIGGGFLVNRDARSDALVRGSYPSARNSWTVEVQRAGGSVRGDATTISAIVYCLAPSGPATLVDIVENAPSIAIGGGGLGTPVTTVRSVCPGGTVATGGGFRIDGPLDNNDARYNGGLRASVPEVGGWRIDVGESMTAAGRRTYAVFALCVTGRLATGTIVTASYAGPPRIGDINVQAVCPLAGMFTTGGGFRMGEGDPLFDRSFASVATAGYRNWSVTIGAIFPADARAKSVGLCLSAP